MISQVPFTEALGFFRCWGEREGEQRHVEGREGWGDPAAKGIAEVCVGRGHVYHSFSICRIGLHRWMPARDALTCRRLKGPRCDVGGR
jgi:hypothetical protein